MNELKVFENQEFGSVRVVEINGEGWLVGKDVAEKLEYQNGSRDINRHVDEDDRMTIDIFDGKQNRKGIVINESGLYALVLGSNLKSAKRYKKWVTSEVLPSIRKHGAYMTDNTIEKALTDPDFLIQLATTLKEEKAARLEAERKNAILMHVNKLYTATEVAKELGLKSAQSLNQALHERKIQYQSNGTWVLYSNYADMGLVSIKQNVLDNGKVIYDRKWTQEGRKFLLDLYQVQ